jgi:phosphoribosylamine--glycine ligase
MGCVQSHAICSSGMVNDPMKKNILIIGGGGREHALAWKIRQSSQANHVFVAPGNAGTALEAGIQNVAIATTDIPALITFAKNNTIDLTIVGPEGPLALGIVDAFSQVGLACFGPTQAAARLESSKVFSKQFMHQHQIPTADDAVFTDLQTATAYLNTAAFPLVIKADGLAAGKGVVVAHTKQIAIQALAQMLSPNQAENAQKPVLIETFIQGEEVSFIVVADGEHAIPLATSQDHKTRDNGDKGPNTGGMGAYSPAPLMTDALQQKIMDTIILPTLKGLAAQGCPYTGFLYAGLMITPRGEPAVLEFNCRLGDPETQPILMRLQSDLITLCTAALAKKLPDISLHWDTRPALGVVMAAKGYPDHYTQGDTISHLPDGSLSDCKVFHAGTKLDHGFVKTAGGRVLCVTALGQTLENAQKRAYDAVKNITWGSQYYRTDIGDKGL